MFYQSFIIVRLDPLHGRVDGVIKRGFIRARQASEQRVLLAEQGKLADRSYMLQHICLELEDTHAEISPWPGIIYLQLTPHETNQQFGANYSDTFSLKTSLTKQLWSKSQRFADKEKVPGLNQKKFELKSTLVCFSLSDRGWKSFP